MSKKNHGLRAIRMAVGLPAEISEERGIGMTTIRARYEVSSDTSGVIDHVATRAEAFALAEHHVGEGDVVVFDRMALGGQTELWRLSEITGRWLSARTKWTSRH